MKDKPYLFNNEAYYDLNSLALAYQNNFDKGMEDITINTKKLIKFVKKCRYKDNIFVNEIISILYSSKYKNSALTFIIFNFSNDKIVVINGQKMTLDEFISALKGTNPSKDNALYAFLEDHGLSRTYARLNNDSKLLKDSYYIERNCYNKFTIDYLTTYDEFEIKESLNGKISTIAINGEECFRRGSKATKNETFQLCLAHRAGFKEAIEMNKDVNPIFKATIILNKIKECEENHLRKLITNTFYWWLLDNFDKYLIVKKKSKKVFLNIIELKKEYQKCQDLIAQRKRDCISFELLADLSRKLYINYLEFVKLYKEGSIVIKNKVQNKDRYDFNKPYCDTFICQDFMEGKTIKLQGSNDSVNEKKINPLTGEEIIQDEVIEIDDDIIVDYSQKVENYDDKELLIYKKKNNKLKRLSAFTIFICISLIVIYTILICFSLFINLEELNDIFSNINYLTKNNIFIYLIGYLASFICVIISIILTTKASNKINLYYDLVFINSFNNMNDYSKDKENELYCSEVKYNLLIDDIDNFKKKINKSNRVLSAFILALYSISIVVFGIIIMGFVSKMIQNINFLEVVDNYFIYIIFAACFIISLIFGFIKKYKGILSSILIAIITLVIVFVMFII